MAYKNYTAITEGAPDTEVAGFTGNRVNANGVYTLANKNTTAKNRRWIHGEYLIALNPDTSTQRWEIYKQLTKATVTANSIVYTRNEANDTEIAIGWVNGANWRYTSSSTPTTSDYVYTDQELSDTATRESITQVVKEGRDVATYSTDSTAPDDPINCSWTTSGITLAAIATAQQLVPAVTGKEIAVITVEAYNQSDANGNLTFIRKDPEGNIVFQFSIGLVSLETVAMNHKMLIPEGYTMEVSATVRGIRVCLNCSETEVV